MSDPPRFPLPTWVCPGRFLSFQPGTHHPYDKEDRMDPLDTMDGGTEGLRFRYSIPTGRIKADGMIFNAYHASAGDMAAEDD